jgi:hypothetical protein
MLRRTAAVCVLALALASSVGTADSEPDRAEEKTYIAPAGDLGAETCLYTEPLPDCYGGADFFVNPADTRVIIDAVDARLPQYLVGFSWEIWRGGSCGLDPQDAVYGCAVAKGSGCSHLDLTLPRIGGLLVIFVDGPVYGLLDCGRYVGASVEGTIRATFYRE